MWLFEPTMDLLLPLFDRKCIVQINSSEPCNLHNSSFVVLLPVLYIERSPKSSTPYSSSCTRRLSKCPTLLKRFYSSKQETSIQLWSTVWSIYYYAKTSWIYDYIIQETDNYIEYVQSDSAIYPSLPVSLLLMSAQSFIMCLHCDWNLRSAAAAKWRRICKITQTEQSWAHQPRKTTIHVSTDSIERPQLFIPVETICRWNIRVNFSLNCTNTIEHILSQSDFPRIFLVRRRFSFHSFVMNAYHISNCFKIAIFQIIFENSSCFCIILNAYWYPFCIDNVILY